MLTATFMAAAAPYIGYGVGALLTYITAKKTLFTVGQNKEGLVSRFGKYVGAPKTSGLNWKIPFIDKLDTQVSTALTAIPAELETKTSDDQFIRLPIDIQFEVRDTAKFYYQSNNPTEQIKTIVSAAVRKSTSGKTFAEIYSLRQEISDNVKENVLDEIADYGIDIKRIVIDEPQADENVKSAYNRVKASEREKQAAENEAQAAYIKSVKAAEADKERNSLIGEGVKAFRKSVAESYIETRQSLIEAGVDEKAADAFMTEAMRLDTMRDAAEKGNVIIMDTAKGKAQNDNSMADVLAAMRVNGPK